MYEIYHTIMRGTLHTLIGLMLAGFSAVPVAGENSHDYNHVATELFWNQLYAGGGWTLYCGLRFDHGGESPEGYAISIDHIYPTEWIQDHLQCSNRSRCYASNNSEFMRMESDMHNLYPAWSVLTMHRNGRSFGMIEQESWRFDNCDIEWKAGTVEPRPLARGNIARAIFYMHRTYGVPIPAAMLDALKEWNRDDPPSRQEKARNDRIEQLQGRRNPYIDSPQLAEDIGPGQ